MTTKIFTSYIAVVITAITLALMGVTLAYASEVTGVLSSDASSGSLNNGALGGNVTGENSDSDSGTLSGNVTGGSGGGGVGNRSTSNPPPGSVLGASTTNVPAPSFPNAGFAPQEHTR